MEIWHDTPYHIQPTAYISYDTHWLRNVEEIAYKTIQFNSISAYREVSELKIDTFNLPVCKALQLLSC